MSMHLISAGRNVPDDCNVVVEIPMLAAAIKYEVDKETGAIFVDRFMSTAMHYPCNYGYIPETLCGDGDPIDVLVITPVPLLTGIVVRCRPVGLLRMEDESGEDTKILAVPIDSSCGLYVEVQSPGDLPPSQIRQISHFFEHYKDLESGKFVKIGAVEDADAARTEILAARAAYRANASG